MLSACHRDTGVKINTTMTQLYVGNCANGYGTEWLSEISADFEEMYKDYSFEEGKKGVQIVPSTDGYDGTTLLNNIASSDVDVIFSEQAYYYDFVSRGLLKDITDIVKEQPLTEFGESGTIYDKLDTQYKSFLESYDGKIYALPWWSGLRGIIYDMDLFEDRGAYIAKNGAPSEAFVEDENGNVIGSYNGQYQWTKTGEKSAGPDGKYGTYDDGLPATYEEFYALCDHLVNDCSTTPFIWTGQYMSYPEQLVRNLYTDYQGLENMRLAYDLEGVCDDVVQSYTIGSDGYTIEDITYKKDSPDAEGLTINYENGYEMQATAGKLYALSFAKRLVSEPTWYSTKCFTGSESHTQAQRSFLYGKYEEALEDCAMLLDGSWWMNEASGVFDEMAGIYDKASRSERGLGFMPMPKATQEQVGEPTTIISYKNAFCFINANCTGPSYEAAKAFFRYVHSDEGLKTFTRVSSAIRPFDYTYTETELQELDSFARSMYETNQSYTIVYPVASNPLYVNSMSYFVNDHFGWESVVAGQIEQLAIDVFYHNNISVKTYFDGIVSNYSKTNWDARFSDLYGED